MIYWLDGLKMFKIVPHLT